MRKLISVSLVAALCLTLGWGKVISGVSHCLVGIEGIIGDGDAKAFTVPAAAATYTLTVVSFKKRLYEMHLLLDGVEVSVISNVNPNGGTCFREVDGLAAGDYTLELKVAASEQVFCLDFHIEDQDLTLLLVTNHNEDGSFEVRAIRLPGALELFPPGT